MKNDSQFRLCPLLSFCAFISVTGSMQGALVWNSTTDVPATGGTGMNQFTTQSFTPSGSLNFGSYHTATDLGNITLNFDGLTVNGGGLENLTGELQNNGGTDDARIAFRSTSGYTSGDVLKFSFSWANQMVSDKAGAPFGGTSLDSFSGGATKTFPTDGWANMRNQFLWDNTGQFSSVVWDLMGPNVGNATGDFYDGFGTTDPLSPLTKVSDDHAQFTYTGIPDNNSWLNDTEDAAGAIDNWAVESFMVTATLAEDIAVGSFFAFTFDGISNGIESSVDTIPEPSRALLLGLGFIVLASRRRR